MRVKNGNLLHEDTVLFYRFEFFGKHDGILRRYPLLEFGQMRLACTTIIELAGIADPPRPGPLP